LQVAEAQHKLTLNEGPTTGTKEPTKRKPRQMVEDLVIDESELIYPPKPKEFQIVPPSTPLQKQNSCGVHKESASPFPSFRCRCKISPDEIKEYNRHITAARFDIFFFMITFSFSFSADPPSTKIQLIR